MLFDAITLFYIQEDCFRKLRFKGSVILNKIWSLGKISVIVFLLTVTQMQTVIALDCKIIKQDVNKMNLAKKPMYQRALTEWQNYRLNAIDQSNYYQKIDCNNQSTETKINPELCRAYKKSAIDLGKKFLSNPNYGKPSYSNSVNELERMIKLKIVQNPRCFSPEKVAGAINE